MNNIKINCDEIMLKGIKDLEIMVQIFEFDSEVEGTSTLLVLFEIYDREIVKLNHFSGNYNHYNT